MSRASTKPGASAASSRRILGGMPTSVPRATRGYPRCDQVHQVQGDQVSVLTRTLTSMPTSRIRKPGATIPRRRRPRKPFKHVSAGAFRGGRRARRSPSAPVPLTRRGRAPLFFRPALLLGGWVDPASSCQRYSISTGRCCRLENSRGVRLGRCRGCPETESGRPTRAGEKSARTLL